MYEECYNFVVQLNEVVDEEFKVDRTTISIWSWDRIEDAYDALSVAVMRFYTWRIIKIGVRAQRTLMRGGNFDLVDELETLQ